ncbi:filamentous hemagglutinin N-terminal domain-containing protein, partial [Nostoc flagelliforme FACHB-838]
GNTFNITGGTQAGGNLFHSFSEFSVNTGGTASFNNALNIQNIISRVTGGSASSIDGIISTKGAANLFLINPNGIIFGQNAQLSIGGSFVGTTANAISFGNQGFFSSSNPESSPSLLTVNPSALLFNQIKTASIQNNSVAPSGLNLSSEFIATGLRVPDGKSLLLVGGDINMDGGGLYAFGGQVELGGSSGAGTIGLNLYGNILSLSFPDNVERSDVLLSNGAGVNVISGGDGGSITVHAQNLEMTGGSELLAGIDTRLGSDNSKAGNIEVNATGVINVKKGSFIGNDVLVGARGQAGNININADILLIQDGTQVSTSTFGAGKGGNLNVDAQDVQIIGRSADGQFGSGLFANAGGNSTGDAGDLTIKTNTLLIKDGAQVSASTFSVGKGGNLSVDAQDVQIIGTSANGRFSSGLFADARPNSTGEVGDLTIKTNTLLVRDGAQIGAGTFGAGKGGNLSVDAQDVQIIGTSANGQFSSGLFASAEGNLTGDAGDLTIETNTLLIKDGAAVSAGTFGAGKGGNLSVDAQDVQIIGRSADGEYPSALSASAQRNSTGDAGDLTIKTNTLLIKDGAGITVQSLGTGTAGNMRLNASSIRLDNNALLSGTTQSAKVDPNREQVTISINSKILTITRNSNIRTNATGENVIGGNINIDTDFLIAFKNSDISANSTNFRGGNVRINAQGIFGTQFRDVASDSTSDITATGASPEFNGSVELNTPDVNPNSGLVELPTIGVETEVAQVCDSPGSAQSSFIITGRGGLPPNPTKDILPANTVEVGWISPKPSSDANSGRRYANDGLRLRSNPPVTRAVTTTPERIVEASGWALNEKGEVVLTANVPAGGRDSWQKDVPCSVSQAAHQ